MKHKMIQKLIAASMIAGSVVSLCPAKTLAAGVVNYYINGQSAGRWVKQNDRWYYIVNGQPQKGWLYDNNQWYYTDSAGIMQTGLIQIDGKIYSFAQNGTLQLNNVAINGIIYQVGEDGALVGDNLPVPSKAFDWNVTSDNVIHPSNTVDTSKNTHTDNPYAAYDPLAPKETYQVEFKDDDGEELRIRNVKDKDTISLYTPTKKGYTFVEWNTKKNGNGDSYDADEEIRITKDMTLYAVWEENEDNDNNSESDVIKVTDISISSAGDARTITENGGTLQFTAEVLPVDADNKKVTWSVESDTGEAEISSNGLLKAKSNGVVKVTATAADGSGAYDSMRITISGQISSGSSAGSDPDNDNNNNNNNNNNDNNNDNPQITEITGSDLTVNNKTSSSLLEGNTYGTLRISTNTASGVTLKNIKANKLVINGGEKIKLENCKVNYIEVLRPTENCEIILDGSTAEITNVSKGVTLSGSGYSVININTDEVVTILGDAKVVNINKLNSKVKVEGTIGKMKISSEAANSIIEGTGSIKEVICDASNVKLGVGSVGSITGDVTNSDLNGLVKEAALIEKYTKLVEKAEENQSTDNSELLNYIKTQARREGPYKGDWENLQFRVEQLNKNNNDKNSITEARNYVTALEKMSKIDPTSAVSLKVSIPTAGDAVTVTVNGEGQDYTIDQLMEETKKKVAALDSSLNDRKALLNRISEVNAVVDKAKKIKAVSNKIDKTNDNAVTLEEYAGIGTTNIKKDQLSIVNMFVGQLENNTEFKKPFPETISSDNQNAIVNALDSNLNLINIQVNSGIKYQKLVDDVKSALDSVNRYCINNNLDSGNGPNNIEVLNTLKASLSSIKTNMNSINEKIQLNGSYGNAAGFIPIGMIKSGETAYEQMIQSYNNYENVLKQNTIKLMDNQFNAFYSNTEKIVENGSINSIYLDSNSSINKHILPNVTQQSIDSVNENLKLIKGGTVSSSSEIIKYSSFFTSDQIAAYNKLYDDINSKFAEMNNVLKALEGKIRIGNVVAVQSGTKYIATISTSSRSSDYTIGTDGSVTLKNGGSAPVFNVNGNAAEYTPVFEAEADYSVTLSGTWNNFKIADITPATAATETQAEIPGTIVFSRDQTSNLPQVSVTRTDSAATHLFNVSLSGQNINNNYVVTMTVTLVY